MVAVKIVKKCEIKCKETLNQFNLNFNPISQKNIGKQWQQSRWRFFSQYGKIYHDNLRVLHFRPVSP